MALKLGGGFWNIKVFENFFDLFYENQGKKISSPPGQNPDILSSTVFLAAMTFKHKSVLQK